MSELGNINLEMLLFGKINLYRDDEKFILRSKPLLRKVTDFLNDNFFFYVEPLL